jgi:hypothetical protein
MTAATGSAALHNQVSEVAPTLCVLYLYDEDGLYLFHHGVRLDLTYRPRGAVRIDPSEDARILHDPEGVLTRELGTQYMPTPPSHPRFFEMGDPATSVGSCGCSDRCRAGPGAQPRATTERSTSCSTRPPRSKPYGLHYWRCDAGRSAAGTYFGGADPDTAAELVQTARSVGGSGGNAPVTWRL